MATCRFCAESIPEGATLCPHCQSDLSSTGVPPLVPVPTSGKALASMVLGILGGFWITAILALIFGYQARSEIKEAKGHLAGDEMARAGIILGWVYAPFLAIVPIILIIAAIAIPNLLRSRMSANEASAVGTTRFIISCAAASQPWHPDVGFPDSLSAMGPEGDNCLDSVIVGGLKNGYRFSYEPAEAIGGVNTGFTVSAVPANCDRTGVRTFFADESGVIRFTNSPGDCSPATAESTPLM